MPERRICLPGNRGEGDSQFERRRRVGTIKTISYLLRGGGSGACLRQRKRWHAPEKVWAFQTYASQQDVHDRMESRVALLL